MYSSTIKSDERLKESELVLNSDGSVYHLHLKEEHVADTVLLVGDQGRVKQISKFFDSIDCSIQNREFYTETGWFNGKRITALSTGIGTDNIDIAINELDAAVNIDLANRTIKPQSKALNLIRIGTSGALQADIEVDQFAISSFGLGFDGLLHFYQKQLTENERAITDAFSAYFQQNNFDFNVYVAEGSSQLIQQLEAGMVKGITATANGFYGPQGRALRLKPFLPEQNELLNQFRFNEHRIVNFEMETSGLYGIGGLLGHNCCTVCAVIANRFTKTFSKDYKKTVDQLILTVLQRLTA